MIVASVPTPRLLLLYSVSVCGKCVGFITDHIKMSNGLPRRGMNSGAGEQKSPTTVELEIQILFYIAKEIVLTHNLGEGV